jgi:MFS family permease
MDGREKTALLSEADRLTAQHYKILVMAWAGWLFDFYDLLLYSFLLPPIGAAFQLSKLDLSYLLGASLAATALGGVLFGWLSDRFGRKHVLTWTILTYSAGTLLSGVAPNFLALLLARLLTGTGVGGEWATGQTYIGETVPPPLRGRFGALMQTGAPVGVALAALVGGVLAPSFGWRACFLLSAAPALLVFVIRRQLPESDLWLARQAQQQPRPGTSGIAALFTPDYRLTFLQCLVLATFDMSAYWFTFSWLPDYLYEERHLTLTRSSAWVAVTQLGALLGYLSFGLAADRVGRRPTYSAYALVTAIGLALVTFGWSEVGGSPPALLAAMLVTGMGFGMFSGYGPLFAELFPTAIRNTAMGAAFNLARGVQFFTPIVVTLVARRYGLGGGISLAILFALLTGAWIWTFRETKGAVLRR